MPGPGRNEPCPCGSGRKVKRCCGQRRGPSQDQLAVAHLAALADDALDELVELSEATLESLGEQLYDLPTIDLSLHVTLPQLITPELQCLREAAADDDPDSGWDEFAVVTDQIDTPTQRARLADAILELRDHGRVPRALAAYAVYNLSTPSRLLLSASVIHTVSVWAGASRTPGGLQVAA